VILSGALDDGSAGLFAVKSRGGIAVVQDPADAIAAEMPQNAMKNVAVDYCLPLKEISAVLTGLARGEAGATIEGEKHMASNPETKLPLSDPPPAAQHIALACPECNGPLYEDREGPVSTFRCNVLHAYSPLSLSAAHDEALERALWVAIRTLNERITLYRQMLRRERNEGEQILFERMEESVQMAEQDVVLLRQIIERI
jgi:two-component system chemotaxis response regulator CheB